LEGKASDEAPVIGPITEEILKLGIDAQVVISTRYGRQAPVLRKKFGRRVRIVDHVVDSTALLYYSSFFIGAGGTMTVEAALLGIPTVSCFPGEKPDYIKYLEKKRLVQTIGSPNRIARVVSETLSSGAEQEAQKERGTRLLRWMQDPIEVISRVVKRSWNTKRS
jgi:predicted glycosyltransferase